MLARSTSGSFVANVKHSVERLEGAFSLVLLTDECLMAVRDPHGFRPLVLGARENARGEKSLALASETCALDLIGAHYVREIEPGEIFWVDRTGERSVHFGSRAKRRAHCIFEHVYFARPDSLVFGRSVYETRKNLGRILAREIPVAADIVVPVPDSGVPAAIGYSEASRLPFELGIIRNHYVGRTFIQPTQSMRSFGVKIKLNPQAAVLRDKRVVVIDDSLVRGNTCRKVIGLVRQAGAREVHLRIAAPPTISPCFYGVDTPRKTDLIAAQKSLEEIRKFLEADSLAYLSFAGLLEGVRGAAESFCTACFTGDYPTALFDSELAL
jgi:amidophosphoribosyltransferase